MLLLLITFLAGILTVITPCVLPMIPVIVGGSVAGGANRKKAYVVTLSLGASVFLFTLLLKVSTLLISVPQSVWEWISGGIIALLGLSLLFPDWWARIALVGALGRKSNAIMAEGYQRHDFWGDLLTGAALGPVFSSCSPTYFVVLATVLPQNRALGIVYLLSYSLGLCLTLLIVSLAGQKLLMKLGAAADPKGWLQKTVGVLLILVGIAIGTGVDRAAETNLVNNNYFDATKIEQRFLSNDQM
ncbi:MAG TPA: cytochrome c biogenesis protein CcdA [Candidatus Paceibacterota bacterium]|jgi:cytochrome c biogenesis protein CcdA|nr:cytochrome c biogenesis protein CcdA [Candidatus Paceibacterota bacterium]